MEDSPMSLMTEEAPAEPPLARRIAPYIAAALIAASGLIYAAHEHHSAQALAAENQQVMAQLNATHSQLAALSTQLNQLAANAQAQPEPQAKPSPAVRAEGAVVRRHAAVHRTRAQDLRFKKLQSEVDAQGREIEADREEASNDLNSTRTELNGSIARTHDQLVLLEKKGARNYFEFDLNKSKQFQRTGPLSVSLRKANEKHQYADLNLIVDDRTVQQKHVNLYQPVMFYTPDTQLPVEVVINSISKNHIHGYISVPKYRQSELAAASDDGGNANAGQGAQSAGNNTVPTLQQRVPE